MKRRRIGSVIVLGLASAGIALSVYLTLMHIWKLLDPKFVSLCEISQTMDCGAVNASRYARLFGLPLGLYGAGFYGALFILSILNLFRSERLSSVPAVMVGLSAASVAVSVALAVISHFLVGAFCLFCMLTWLVNFLVFGTALWMMESPPGKSLLKAARELLHAYRSAGYYAAGFVFLGVVWIGGALFHTYEAQAEDFAARRIAGDITSGKGPGALYGKVDLPPIQPTPGVSRQRADIRLEGHEPISGTAGAPIQIVVFSDFECPYCQRAAFALNAVRERFPDEVSVVYKQYPLDYDCNPYMHQQVHEHACKAAFASICAKRQGRFWEMHDKLFENRTHLEDSAILSYAEAIGLDTTAFTRCLDDRSVVIEVNHDIDEGKRLKIRGTPTIYINGRLWMGPISRELFIKTIDRLLSD